MYLSIVSFFPQISIRINNFKASKISEIRRTIVEVSLMASSQSNRRWLSRISPRESVTYIMHTLLKGCRSESINSASSHMSMQYNNTREMCKGERLHPPPPLPSPRKFNFQSSLVGLFQSHDTPKILQPGFALDLFPECLFRSVSGMGLLNRFFFSRPRDFYWNLCNDLWREFLYLEFLQFSNFVSVGCMRKRS